MPISPYVFSQSEVVSVPVADGRLFLVRRIYCVGRNYPGHIREMGNDPARDSPIFFMKPTDAIVLNGATVRYPPKTTQLHHEVELVLAIGKGGRDLSISQAPSHVFGEAVGVDLTRRDLQTAARQAGHPWETGKAFDQSAPCGALRPCGGALLNAGTIALSVNGVTRQAGELAERVWDSARIVSAVSSFFRLEPGDLIFTGTPQGVGPLNSGDEILAQIVGLPTLEFSVA